jgi:hypothetical protein
MENNDVSNDTDNGTNTGGLYYKNLAQIQRDTWENINKDDPLVSRKNQIRTLPTIGII